MLVHKNPKQVKLLIDALNDSCSLFFLHLDKNISISLFKQLSCEEVVRFIKNRIKCEWGRFSLVDATIKSITEINSVMSKEYNSCRYHITILSGEDYPMWGNSRIHEFLCNNLDISFIHHWTLPYNKWYDGGLFRFKSLYFTNSIKFRSLHKHVNKLLRKAKCDFLFPLHILNKRYPDIQLYGQTQWCIISDTLCLQLPEIHRKSKLKKIFKFTFAPDETYLITLIKYLIPASKVLDINTHFAKFIDLEPNPKYLKLENLKEVPKNAIYARKFSFEAGDPMHIVLEGIRNIQTH